MEEGKQAEMSSKDQLLINETNEKEEKVIKLSYGKKKRLVALDVLRGMTVFLMIVVNSQPGKTKFTQLDHAKFNGLTATDFIFPFFLWIMGYAMGIVFSRKKTVDPTETVEKHILWKTYTFKKQKFEQVMKWVRIFRRSILLWILGFGLSVISNLFDFRFVRFPGVLQRISFCYFCISCLLSWIPSTLVQIVIIFNLHLIYLFFMFCVPYPNCAAGDITEYCSGESFFDIAIFGREHIYQYCKYYDPEGSLSSLTSLSTTYFGVIFFKIAQAVKEKHGNQTNGSKYRLIAFWLLLSICLVFIGMILNAYMFPYNKHLWSSAFVFATAGSAGIFLSVITFVVDILNVRFWIYLFLWTGVNPLVMYVLPEYVATIAHQIPVNGEMNLFHAVYEYLFHSWLSNENWGNALFGLAFESLFLPLACVLFYQGIFIKL